MLKSTFQNNKTMNKTLLLLGFIIVTSGLVAQSTVERKTFTYSVRDGKELLLDTYTDHMVALKPLQHNFGETDTFIDKFIMQGNHATVHTVWADEKPDSMNDMIKVVPLYIMEWEKTDDEIK